MEIEMLQPERVRAWCQRIRMPEGGSQALSEIAAVVSADEALRKVFADFYAKTALRGEWHTEWGSLPMDPQVAQRMGDEKASLFYLLGYMAALPLAEQTYLRLGIPLEIFDQTMTDIAFYTNKPYQIHGQWKFREFMWIWRHLSCRLFRLGRMQYIFENFSGGVMAFRNRQSGQVRLLHAADIPLRPDGYAQGAGKRDAERSEERAKAWRADPTSWFARIEETEAGWRGNLVEPMGCVQREPVFLSRAEWECVLKKDDTVLDLHIPRGQNLTIADCRDSLRQAQAFFTRYWPERPYKAVICHTWLFTPQLQEILPPESNIVRFQREFYLYPHPGGPQFLWNFVFGEKYPDPSSAPRDSALRRAVLDWLADGKEIFDLPGLMVHGPDQWGTQPYYSNISV